MNIKLRHRAGLPVGGRFAPHGRHDAAVTLSDTLPVRVLGFDEMPPLDPSDEYYHQVGVCPGCEPGQTFDCPACEGSGRITAAGFNQALDRYAHLLADSPNPPATRWAQGEAILSGYAADEQALEGTDGSVEPWPGTVDEGEVPF